MLLAQEAMVACALDEVWFIPVQLPPHKTREQLTEGELRYTMIKKAIEGEENFKVIDIELEREGPSYTVDTVGELKTKHPFYEFYFIIGGDMVEYLPKWERIDQLLHMVTFIGFSRPGIPFSSPYPGRIIEVQGIEVAFSSTAIRQRVFEKKPIRYMVPEGVRAYIEEKGLYQGNGTK